MDIKKTTMYLLEWLIPSSTAVYILLSQKILWGQFVIFGTVWNIPAYVIACMVGAMIYYPINKYIFKGCHKMKIKVVGTDVEVNEHSIVNVDTIGNVTVDGRKYD